MKQKSTIKAPIKSKKSQESFYKPKIAMPQTEQIKILHNKKSQNRFSQSFLEILPSSNKASSRRVSSLEINSPVLQPPIVIPNSHSKIAEQIRNKKPIEQTSDKNIILINQSSNLYKYRKLSSHAQFKSIQDNKHKRKLSLVGQSSIVQHQQILPQKNIKANTLIWIIAIRKIFTQEDKKLKLLKLCTIINNLTKIDKKYIQYYKKEIPNIKQQKQYTMNQIIHLIQNNLIKKQNKNHKSQNMNSKYNFYDISYLLLKIQKINIKEDKNKSNSSQDHEESVETARFQQNHANQNKKNKKIQQQINKIKQIIFPHQQILTNNILQLNKMTQYTNSQKHKSNITNKNRQSLMPSLSPFNFNDKNSQNSSYFMSRQQSESMFMKKKSLSKNGLSQSSLGRLTLQGKSPRQLMQSQIFESMQKLGNNENKNNISFSTDNYENDIHISFQQTVQQFESILKKVKQIQLAYTGKTNDPRYNDINDFLEQLINYSINKYSIEQYSYSVIFKNVQQLKDQNNKILQALVQTSQMKDYFRTLEGIKIYNSKYIFQNISGFLHNNIKILNISYNNISNIRQIFTNQDLMMSLQFLNIQGNHIKNIERILQKSAKLKQLHSSHNLIEEIRCVSYDCQITLIDLSHNKIQKQQNISNLKHLKHLQIINLHNNPILLYSDNSSLKQLNNSSIYDMQQIYIMSNYVFNKQLTFNKQKIQKQIKDNKNIENSITNFNKKQKRQPLSQNLNKQINYLSIKDEKQPPKQKISKIKVLIDGK